MKNIPSVAIIILNWNGIEWTRACLKSVGTLDYSNYQVFVVDNNSDNDEAGALEREFTGQIKVFKNKANLGFAQGNNVALESSQLAHFDYYLLLNNDTELQPDLLRSLVEAGEKNTHAGIIGPIVKNWDGLTVQSMGAPRVNLWTGSASLQRSADSSVQYEEVQMVSGCCFLIKRTVVEKIGVLDPDYFAYYEETDYCLRALRAGFKIMVVKEVSMKHFDGGSAKKVSVFQENKLLHNRFLLVAKNGNTLQKLVTFLYVSLFYFWVRGMILLARGQSSLLGALVKGYFEGVGSLLRV